MRLSKENVRDVYRPTGPKSVQTGITWTGGGSTLLSQALDLSIPIRAIRLTFKGRVVIGTAAMTSVNPEGFLNLISNITIQGVNARQQGNVTLWNIDLATLWVMSHLFGYRSNIFTINAGSGETIVPIPTTPFPASGATGYINGATGTYDFRIVVDLPFHPMGFQAFGNHSLAIPGFLVRNEEWKDSISISLTYGNQLGNSTGSLGVAAATTTVTFSSYGSGAGSPTIDIESIPVMSGLQMKDSFLPGVLSRAATPITTILPAAGTNVPLLNFQKQPTPRVLFKIGTSTVSPAFATLSDTNLTQVGTLLGGNRNVRNKLDIWKHKQHTTDIYQRDPIQGYSLFDFIEQGNYDSSFPGQDVGDGATLQLVGDVTGVANALGLIVQEQLLHAPTGPYFS